MFVLSRQGGFSLVELSVVLVIIGIIVGGVVASVSVVHNAKLKVVIKEARQYQQAFDIFKEKFKHYPGDFPGAGRYWGDDCQGATGGSDLCSGDGDYAIKDGADDSLSGTAETHRAWLHLLKSNLVSGSYTGLPGNGSNCSGDDSCVTVGENAPKSQWGNNSGYYMYSGTSETAIFLGKNAADTWNSGSSMKPEDSLSLDTKFDDGDPVTGYFRASSITGKVLANSATCLDGGTTYNLDNTSEDCGAIFIFDGLK